MHRLPPKIQAALDDCDGDYTLEIGTKHVRIRVHGLFCGILPRGKARCMDRAEKNIVAQIRRANRGRVDFMKAGTSVSRRPLTDAASR